MKKPSSACFICETPFQLFNAIHFALNQKDFSFQNIDLFLCTKIKNHNTIAALLQSEQCFHHINLYSYDSFPASSAGRFLEKYGHVVLPKEYLLTATNHRLSRASLTNYTHIFISVLSGFAMAICTSNANSKTYYFDDGLGSYVGKISSQNITLKRRVLYTLTGKNYKQLYPQALYVHNVDLCHTGWNVPIRSLPKLPAGNDLFWNIIHRIFGEPNSNYQKIPTVLLSQPIARESANGIAEIDPVCQAMESMPFIFRPHPLDSSIPASLEVVDTSNVLWELICAQCITEKHILIGVCSTAQSSPKIMFGKEPFLIFTYKLYSTISDQHQALYQNLAENIKSTYQHPEKVAVVENYADLQKTLHHFLNKQ